MQYFIMRAIDNTHSSFPNFRYNAIMAEHLTDHSQLLWDTHARLGIGAPSTAREFPKLFTVPRWIQVRRTRGRSRRLAFPDRVDHAVEDHGHAGGGYCLGDRSQIEDAGGGDLRRIGFVVEPAK